MGGDLVGTADDSLAAGEKRRVTLPGTASVDDCCSCRDGELGGRLWWGRLGWEKTHKQLNTQNPCRCFGGLWVGSTVRRRRDPGPLVGPWLRLAVAL